MELQSLTATTRTDGGKKSETRQIRVNGEVPGVLYGSGKDPVSLKINTKAFVALTHGSGGEHAIVDLKIEGGEDAGGPAMLKAVQHHPLRDEVLHVDFVRIKMDERLATKVQVRLTGQSVGVVEGGVLDHQMREIEIECLPLDVPEEFVVDVSELNIGDSLHASDIAIPEGVTLLTDPERPVAAVLAPRVVEEETAEEGEEGEEGAEGAAGAEGAEGEESKE